MITVWRAQLTAFLMVAAIGVAAPPASAGLERQTLNINGKSGVMVAKLSPTSWTRVESLIERADDITSSDGLGGAAGLMAGTDVVVVTNKYLAWLDRTRTGGDPWGGGLLAGLWYLQGSGEALNFRNDGAWNELLPWAGNNGAGHSLIVNTDVGGGCDDNPNLQFHAQRQASPTLSRDGEPSAVFPNGVSFEHTGWFTHPGGSRDLAPSVGGTQSLRYRVRYDFGEDADTIRVETAVDRDAGNGNANVSVLFGADYDTVSDWNGGYNPNNDRSNRVSNANTARTGEGDNLRFQTRAAGVEGDIPNDLGWTAVNWWQSSGPAGTEWYMKDHEFSPNQEPDRGLRITSISGPSGSISQFTKAMHVYNPGLRSYSLEFDAIANCNPGGTALPRGWNFTWHHDISTRFAVPPPPPPACSDGADNDSDGLTDYPADPGCSSSSDTDEFNAPPPTACSDGVDNDGDGLRDYGSAYPADPGCSSPSDTDEWNPAPKDILFPSEQLHQGEMLIDKHFRYCFVLQDDANLVIYPRPQCRISGAIWSSGTNGQGTNPILEMGGDGHLVLYADTSTGRRPIWDRPTSGWIAGSKLIMQCDRNLVLYSPGGSPMWSSGTGTGEIC